MNDDFTTPLAFTALYALARKANTILAKQKISEKLAEETIKTLKELGSIFGILEKEVQREEELPEKVKELIAQREEAKQKRLEKSRRNKRANQKTWLYARRYIRRTEIEKNQRLESTLLLFNAIINQQTTNPVPNVKNSAPSRDAK